MENVARFDALSAFAICKEQRTLPRICRGGDAKKVTAIEGKSSAMEISAHIRYVLRRCTGGILSAMQNTHGIPPTRAWMTTF